MVGIRLELAHEDVRQPRIGLELAHEDVRQPQIIPSTAVSFTGIPSFFSFSQFVELRYYTKRCIINQT